MYGGKAAYYCTRIPHSVLIGFGDDEIQKIFLVVNIVIV